MQERRRSDSFVVRIWWERTDQETIWRGWVQHAGSGDSQYFNRPTELLAFVESHTGALTPAPSVKVKGNPGC